MKKDQFNNKKIRLKRSYWLTDENHLIKFKFKISSLMHKEIIKNDFTHIEIKDINSFLVNLYNEKEFYIKSNDVYYSAILYSSWVYDFSDILNRISHYKLFNGIKDKVIEESEENKSKLIDTTYIRDKYRHILLLDSNKENIILPLLTKKIASGKYNILYSADEASVMIGEKYIFAYLTRILGKEDFHIVYSPFYDEKLLNCIINGKLKNVLFNNDSCYSEYKYHNSKSHLIQEINLIEKYS